MGVAAREIEAEILSVLRDSGCTVTGKGHDGDGHKTVTFTLHGQAKTFHFGSSQHSSGCARQNATHRLRRVLRDIPPAPLSIVPRIEPPVSLAPPKPTKVIPRLNATRRKEFAKRYVVVRSIEVLSSETGVTLQRLHILLNSAGGEAQRLYRIDLNKKKAYAAKIRRGTAPIILKKAAAMMAPKTKEQFELPPLPPSKRGAFADNFRREIMITKMVYIDKVPIKAIAKHAGGTEARISQIAKANYRQRNWKLD